MTNQPDAQSDRCLTLEKVLMMRTSVFTILGIMLLLTLGSLTIRLGRLPNGSVKLERPERHPQKLTMLLSSGALTNYHMAALWVIACGASTRGGSAAILWDKRPTYFFGGSAGTAAWMLPGLHEQPSTPRENGVDHHISGRHGVPTAEFWWST